MTDKERILTQIIGLTAYQTTKFRSQSEDSIYWDYIGETTKLKKGDIVCGMTNPNHKFGIAFFEKMNSGPNDLLVREIGSKATCNYENEMFLVLKNFPRLYRLCGHEHKVMINIRKVLNDIYMYALVDIEFEAKKLIITVREKFTRNMQIIEYCYDCPLSRITLKDLRKKLKKLDK